MTKFTREVHSAQEYKDSIEHARALGFRPIRTHFEGNWETDTGRDVMFGVTGSDKDVKKVGHKYFEVPVKTTDRSGNNVTKVMPIFPIGGSTRGAVIITFKD